VKYALDRAEQRHGSAVSAGSTSKLVSLLILCSLLLAGCTREENGTIPTRQPLPHEILEEVVLKEMDKGSVVWILHAGKAANYEEEGVIKVYDVHLEFYDDEENVSSVLTADSGAVFSSNKSMRAMGTVKVVTQEDALLETDMLEWDNAERLIMTEATIRITTNETVITGAGLESDPELKRIKVKRQFRAERIDNSP
jgi:LPS export ABC transporter protein LptC